jgi:cell division protein FtsI/penicillin-binding protein 2
MGWKMRLTNHGEQQQNQGYKISIMCGKTGTVQNNRGKNHSVFIGFAPRENPKIAIAVIVENGGYGGAYAAPIASFITEKYLTDSFRPIAPSTVYNPGIYVC